MELFLGPITLPGPLRLQSETERQISQSILWFLNRSVSLLQAAGLVDVSGEPGLLLPEDLEQAQKAGKAAADCLPKTALHGRAQVGYLRSITQEGLLVKPLKCETSTILQDTCGLGHTFLCALAANALEKGHRVRLCPALTDPQRLEAVLLPELGAAWVSDRTGITGPGISLDSIPDPERRAALEDAMQRDSEMQASLIRHAEAQMQMAGILYRVIE